MERTRRRYAILGTGALGGYYGSLLARAGFDVHFLLNRDLEHVRRQGLRIDSPRGDFHLSEVHAYGSAAEMPPCDVTIVALKTTNNHLLAELLPPVTAGGGVVLVLQNGLGIEADAAAVVGAERVLGGCCFLCTNKVGPGHIRHLDYGRITMGEYRPPEAPPAGVTPRLAAIVDDLRAAEIDAQPVEDLWHARWKKLMWNIPFNGLGVVLDAATDAIMASEPATALAESLMEEVRQAAAACGRPIPPEVTDQLLEHTRAMVAYDSSMRLDYLHGRPMEVEAIFGNPVRMARAGGFEAVRVEMLYRQLRYLDDRAAETSRG